MSKAQQKKLAKLQAAKVAKAKKAAAAGAGGEEEKKEGGKGKGKQNQQQAQAQGAEDGAEETKQAPKKQKQK